MLGIDFTQPFSTFENNKLNGATAMIMQSDENAQKLIDNLKKAINEGYNPNEVLEDICRQLKINLDEMFDYDLKRVKEEIEKYMDRRYKSRVDF